MVELVPIYLKFKSELDYKQNYNTLSEIFIEVNDNEICENNVHIQIYPFSDIVLSFLPFFKKFFSSKEKPPSGPISIVFIFFFILSILLY